jgi:uncharacterized protein (DUF885 family)
MRKNARQSILAAGALGLVLAVAASAAAEPSIDAFFQSYTDQWMRFHTDSAASRRYFTGALQDSMERQVESRSAARRAAEAQLMRKGLDALHAFDRSKLTRAQKLSADIIQWDLDTQLAGEVYRDYQFPFEQMNGANVELPQLLAVTHPVATPRDAENYVARLAYVAPRMDEATAEARRLIAKKMVPPKFIVEKTLAQMRAFIATPAAENPLVSGFAQRMSRVPGIPAARREQLRKEAESITAAKVYPAWQKAIAVLDTALPISNNDAGLWRYPQGAEVYAYRLRQFTTTKRTAEEIHQTGLRMVAEIEGQMDALLKKMGRSQGTVDERMEQLQRERPQFPDTEEGRKAWMADIDATMQDAIERSAALFAKVPKGAVVAQPYPAFMGQQAASYSLGAADGSRPGTFQFTLRPGPRFSHSTIYHETVPGHHFQGALVMEDLTLPRFRRDRIFGNNSANGEGWALYAERVAAESGWYDSDPYGALDQLAQAQFRAKRLVVDTGLHAKKWTRQQAIDYGIPEAEVDRYVVYPGQACSYMIGALKIVELREKAKKELGAKFSLKEFHNAVLGLGRVPLDLLEQQIDVWIAANKA